MENFSLSVGYSNAYHTLVYISLYLNCSFKPNTSCHLTTLSLKYVCSMSFADSVKVILETLYFKGILLQCTELI